MAAEPEWPRRTSGTTEKARVRSTGGRTCLFASASDEAGPAFWESWRGLQVNLAERSRDGGPARGPDAPVYLVLGAVILGSGLTMLTVPLLGVALVAASLALSVKLVAGRRRAAADLTRAVEQAKEREVQSLFVDAMTGLGNRRQLLEQLPLEVARAERYGQPLSLITVKIPDLEQTRERWGTVVTDQAILHVANTLKRISPDTQLVFRLDSGQFAILCQGKPHSRGSHLCEGAALAVENRPILIEGNGSLPLYVTVQTSAVDYEVDRFEGPLEFLSAAGCETEPERPPWTRCRTADAHDLRRRLVDGYEPIEGGARAAVTPVNERKAV